MPSPPDRHIRRSGDDYAAPFLSLLPTGSAWPREPNTALVALIEGLAEYWGFVDSRAADLLEQESDPRKTIELLPEWERAFGLPDPCFIQALSIAERQFVLVLKMTLLGAQSRAWFIEVAGWLGYTITITEYAPFMAGISRAGDTSAEDIAAGGDGTQMRWYIGPPEMRFYWTIHVGQARLTWFRSTAGQAGVDPHLRIGLAEDLECLLRRWKPAHTEIVFDYAGLDAGGPMAGTP